MPLNVTVPVEGVPPTTEVGDTEMPVKVTFPGGSIVSVAEALRAGSFASTAVIVTAVIAVTAVGVIVNVPLVDPAGITT